MPNTFSKDLAPVVVFWGVGTQWKVGMPSKWGGGDVLAHSSLLLTPCYATQHIPEQWGQMNLYWNPKLSQHSLSSIEVDCLSNKKLTRSGTQPMSLLWQCWHQYSKRKAPTSELSRTESSSGHEENQKKKVGYRLSVVSSGALTLLA